MAIFYAKRGLDSRVIRYDFATVGDPDERKGYEEHADLLARGLPFLRRREQLLSLRFDLGNVWISECFNCNELSLWMFDRLLHPRTGEAPPVNPDLSADIRQVYDEASSILEASPRGAAALVRLAIQMLCKELGQPGKNINADIAALVADGLDPGIQKALDYVRVVGNNAVHPGQIDLRDGRDTAVGLFALLNVIADKLISVPKRIDQAYDTLPEGVRDAIRKRDAGK